MATYTATAAQTGIQPKGLRVGLNAVFSEFSADGISASIGTVINMVKVPKGARVMFMSYGTNYTGDHTVQIGDSVSGTRYKSAGTLSAGQGMVVATTFNQNYSYSADDTIVLRISLASVTTLGGGYFMNVIFAMDS